MYLTGLRGRGTSGMEPPNDENVQCMGSQTFCRHIYKGFWTRSATSSLSATALEFFEGSGGMALFVFVFVFILVILERLEVGSWWMTVTFLLFSLPPCENRVLTSLRHDLIFFIKIVLKWSSPLAPLLRMVRVSVECFLTNSCLSSPPHLVLVWRNHFYKETLHQFRSLSVSIVCNRFQAGDFHWCSDRSPSIPISLVCYRTSLETWQISKRIRNKSQDFS